MTTNLVIKYLSWIFLPIEILILLSVMVFFENLEAEINGTLRVSRKNPRYFTDNSGKAIYLTGSHTWSNFQDNGKIFPPPKFDYEKYLDFLTAYNHNFFRLWIWEQSKWTNEFSFEYWLDPVLYKRTGPGKALDGYLKFDLNQFNDVFFSRLRQRIIAAGHRGIYVSIMLFNGFSIEKTKGDHIKNNPWKGHPFNKLNNINTIDGDPNGDDSGFEVHTLKIPAIIQLQETYIRRVIDTVNDLDNVLFEICNESHNQSQDWQYHMIRFIKNYEETKPKQHPIGMSPIWPGGKFVDLRNSPADWISPNQERWEGNLQGRIYRKLKKIIGLSCYDYKNNPRPAEGLKVLIPDTDHLWGIGGDAQWVWKCFMRGLNPIFMDVYDGVAYGLGGVESKKDATRWIALRKAMGYTRKFSKLINLSEMTPCRGNSRTDISSSAYCLANETGPYPEYLIYLPLGGKVRVKLSKFVCKLNVEWFSPETGETKFGNPVDSGNEKLFVSPFRSTHALLYLYRANVGK